jgi:hypothetical protein
MRDRTVAIEDRVEAASFLMLIDRMPGILQQKWKFGELGLKELLESMPPAEQAEVRHAVDRLVRCNVLGIDQLTAWTPIKAMAEHDVTRCITCGNMTHQKPWLTSHGNMAHQKPWLTSQGSCRPGTTENNSHLDRSPDKRLTHSGDGPSSQNIERA